MNGTSPEVHLVNNAAMFILVVCFAPFIFLLYMFVSFFVDRSRQARDEKKNAGWRIQLIPYDESYRPTARSSDSSGDGYSDSLEWAMGAASSWLLDWFCDRLLPRMLLRLDWVAKRDWQAKPGWAVVQGRCTDREIRKVSVRGKWVWQWRIVCNYEQRGNPYRVTPKVNWSSFNSEVAAIQFLESRISPNGECTLRIHPNNSLRTELMQPEIQKQIAVLNAT
jgi:hypothetical protein